MMIFFGFIERQPRACSGSFAAEYKAMEKRIRISKSKAMVLCQKYVECSLQSWDKWELYFRVLLISKGIVGREIDSLIGAASVL